MRTSKVEDHEHKNRARNNSYLLIIEDYDIWEKFSTE